jgi:ADP-ribosylglycohydrolase
VTDRASGSLYGLAFGDALGAPTEFMPYGQILDVYGPGGPRELVGRPARVTDDTQMALAFAEALYTAALEEWPLSPGRLEAHTRDAFVRWAHSPDNNRAPGNTCLRACAGLSEGLRWQDATIKDSKGCGANMRVAPAGVAPGLSDEERAGAAQLQAALTHGHATGLAASELTAFAIWWLCEGMAPADLPGALRERVDSQREIYHERWLGDLWQRPLVDDPVAYISHGWDECRAVLERLDEALAVPDRHGDPCLATGAGWIAEEALATGLYCFLLFPDDPVAAIARGAASSGDSDSIACLAGAFAGAAHGMGAWPAEWVERIEYGDRLARYGSAWDRAGTAPAAS